MYSSEQPLERIAKMAGCQKCGRYSIEHENIRSHPYYPDLDAEVTDYRIGGAL